MIKIRTLKRPWAICSYPDCEVKSPHELYVTFPSRSSSSGTFGVQIWYCHEHLLKVLETMEHSAAMMMVNMILRASDETSP